MADHSGFIDLRIGQGAQGVGDESVWPSFTDVMTVIVMIFMMALVVILVQNKELDRQLLASMISQQTTLQEKTELESSLALTQSDLESTQQSLESTIEDLQGTLSTLSATESERDELEDRLRAELERIKALSGDRERLQAEVSSLVTIREALEAANDDLNQDKSQALAEIEKLVENEELLNQRIERLSEQLTTLRLQSQEEITALTEDKQTLGSKLDTVSTQLAEVRLLLLETQDDNRDLTVEIQQLTEFKRSAEESFAIAEEEIETLRQLIRIREAENAALQAERDASQVQYTSLQEEYEALDEKYRDLIRAARSPAGKYVVDVRVEKVAGVMRYRYSEPGQPLAEVSRQELDLVLQALKDEHGKTLYTRIVIPDNSNLSHNEAWSFTQEILNRFDYYYQ